MNFLRSLAADLRERQIFPAVVLLVLLAIAIPVYASAELSKSPAPSATAVAPVSSAPPKGTPPPAQETATVTTAPTQPSAVYKGQEPDPFRSYGAAANSASTSGTSTATTTPSTTTTSTTTPSTTTPTTTTTPKTSTPSSTPTPTIAPAPSSLKDDEAYTADVTTSYAGQKDELSDLQRLTPLPANIPPEVVYLGVMAGGKKAAFLLGGATFEQKGSSNVDCLPSLSDCQVVELTPGHGFYVEGSSAQGTSKFTFVLDDISFEKYSSSSAATDARKSASPSGQQIVAASTSTELASFFYDVGLGALIYTPPPAGATGSSGETAGTGPTGTTSTTGTSGATNGSAVFGATAAKAFKSSRR